MNKENGKAYQITLCDYIYIKYYTYSDAQIHILLIMSPLLIEFQLICESFEIQSKVNV